MLKPFDHEKAFDSAESATVMHAIRQQSVEEIYCRFLEDIYTDGTENIEIHADTCIKKGLRQDNTVSRKLFTACLDKKIHKKSIRKEIKKKNIKIFKKCVRKKLSKSALKEE